MDLARSGDWHVTVADQDDTRLSRARARYRVHTIDVDLTDVDRLSSLAGDSEIAIITLPSAVAHRALQAVIDAGRHAVSVSFAPEDSRGLSDSASRRGVTAIVDCGVAPGFSNMNVGAAVATLSSCERVDIYVGGVPVDRRAPFEYKAPFSPYDVIDEYVDPVKIVRDGQIVVEPALSDLELMAVAGVGELEAFLTDGLRTLLDTVKARFMREKTLRYPGHASAMRALRDAGFFSKDLVRIGDRLVRPLDATAAILFPQWTYGDGEEDLTILQVVVEGLAGDRRTRMTWRMLDRYDAATQLRSMSRTTAFPATIVARLVVDGALPSGVHPPELVGRLGLLDHVVRELAARGVRCDLATTYT